MGAVSKAGRHDLGLIGPAGDIDGERTIDLLQGNITEFYKQGYTQAADGVRQLQSMVSSGQFSPTQIASLMNAVGDDFNDQVSFFTSFSELSDKMRAKIIKFNKQAQGLGDKKAAKYNATLAGALLDDGKIDKEEANELRIIIEGKDGKDGKDAATYSRVERAKHDRFSHSVSSMVRCPCRKHAISCGRC